MANDVPAHHAAVARGLGAGVTGAEAMEILAWLAIVPFTALLLASIVWTIILEPKVAPPLWLAGAAFCWGLVYLKGIYD